MNSFYHIFPTLCCWSFPGSNSRPTDPGNLQWLLRYHYNPPGESNFDLILSQPGIDVRGLRMRLDDPGEREISDPATVKYLKKKGLLD